MGRILAIAWVLLFGLSSQAWAEEVIRRFISDVTVNVDGSLLVVETITVRAEGNQIKRGIIRDFPTDYRDKNGNEISVDFDLVEVTHNGAPAQVQTSRVNNGVSMRIGDPDVLVPMGDNTYRITYRTTRQLGFFPEFDELYWNVTGNGWRFPIEKAEVIVRLPTGAEIKNAAVYTGYFGGTGRDALITSQRGNVFSAETTRRLNSAEGFTIATSWQKGIVHEPTEAERQRQWIWDHLGYFTAGFTLLATLLYFIVAWFKVGRDPPKGTVIPLFKPPAGLGPAGVRYLWRDGFDDQAFAASLVGLAIKKRLKISESDGDFAVTKTGESGPDLTLSEQHLMASLPGGTLEFKQANQPQIAFARRALSEALSDEFRGSMFLRNFKWFFIGALISVLGVMISMLLIRDIDGPFMLFGAVFSSIWWSVILATGWGVVKGLISSRGFFGKLKNLLGIVFLIPFVLVGVFVPLGAAYMGLLNQSGMIMIGIGLALVAANILFYWLLKAPTEKGQRVLEQIEGFKLYMTTAEEERLKLLHPPEKTPELFERYLPYAMALDCENEWNEKFAAVLAAAAAAGAAGVATQPLWYSGSNWNSRSFTQDLSAGLTSSITSSATPPGSSSGSGGGGSSGGGGGGGGGSGW